MDSPRTLKSDGPFQDPREASDFVPRRYPTANGQEAPPSSSADRNDRIVIEFLAACYHINVAWECLQELRKQPGRDDQDQEERKALQAIEKALLRREALEDQCARIGMVAEPITDNGLAVDVKFTFGNVNAAGRSRFEPIVFTAELPIRVPPRVRAEAQNPPEEDRDSPG